MISIIVHNWNRSFLLPLFIKSYARQNFDHQELEMIIIDDDSPPEDNFEQYLNLTLNTIDIKENINFIIKAFKVSNQCSTKNCGKTMNIGVRQSKGDILLLTHTDMIPMHKNALRILHRNHKFNNKLYQTSKLLSIEKDNIQDLLEPQCGGQSAWGSTISRELYYQIGGFDERFKGYASEEADFSWRIFYGQPYLNCKHIHNQKSIFIHLQQSNMISQPPSIDNESEKIVNDNLIENHRWIVNNADKNPDGWGKCNNLKEIRM